MTYKQNTMIAPQAGNIHKQPTNAMTPENRHPSKRKKYKSSKFWDWIAPRYASKPVPDQQAYQKKLDVTREYLSKDMQVLEIGCGTGTTALLQAPFVKHIYATDFSASMIDIANEKAQSQKVNNVTFEQKNIDELALTDESYDVVMGHSILHLLDNFDQVIVRLEKALKPNGVFVSSTVCLGENSSFFKYIAPIGRFLGILPIINVFSVKELNSAFTQAGFEIDYQWRQGDGNNVFLVARKAG